MEKNKDNQSLSEKEKDRMRNEGTIEFDRSIYKNSLERKVITKKIGLGMVKRETPYPEVLIHEDFKEKKSEKDENRGNFILSKYFLPKVFYVKIK